jgi:hypothetical protein
MKFLNLNTILIVAVAVLVTLQVSSMFRKSSPNESLIRAEMKIEQLEQKRLSDSVLLVEQLKAKDLVIAALQEKDTVYIRNINSSNERVKNIPAAVNNISDDAGLRAAAGEALFGN